jgi:hypothetical protein
LPSDECWRETGGNGFRLAAGKALASNKRIVKIAFAGETTTGRPIMQYARQNLIPVAFELGGKSPNVFFADVMNADVNCFDKALEGFVMFALNQGEVGTCPSWALVEESIYDRFMERALTRAYRFGGDNRAERLIGDHTDIQFAPSLLAGHSLDGHAVDPCLRPEAAHRRDHVVVDIAHAGDVQDIEDDALHIRLVRDIG